MKYHINFYGDKKLSFEILDTPVAHAWVQIMKKTLASEKVDQRIVRNSFPGIHPTIGYSNLKRYYDILKSDGLDPEFVLKKFKAHPSILPDHEYYDLERQIDRLFSKVITNNYYYNEDTKLVAKWAKSVERMKRYKEEMFDSKFDVDVNYTWIKSSNNPYKITITDDMRSKYWVETARPATVLRLQSDVDLRTLHNMQKRNSPERFVEGHYSYMKHITADYKICQHTTSITQEEAEFYMSRQRQNMLNFVIENEIKTNAGDKNNYYFVNPVIGHCTSDISEQEFFELVSKGEEVSSYFED